MSKEQTHIIKSQQYEIELDDSTKSYAYQSKISQLQEHSIQGILQKVMDSFHSPEYLDTYDEIVLDLGTIAPGNFDRELGYKIEEAFTQFFQSNKYNGTLLKGNRKLIHKTQIDKLLFFLKNGYLQWDVPSSENPATLLIEALQHDKEQVIKILKQEGRKETIRKRLITQLQDTSLEQIVIALKSDEAPYINQSRKDIIVHQKQHKLVATTQSYFRDAIWDIILAYVFTQVTSYTNQKNFLKYIIQKVAAKYNVTYKNLLKRIAEGSKKTSLQNAPNFSKIVTQLEEELNAKTKTITQQETSDFASIFQYYLQYNALPSSSKLSSIYLFSSQLKTFIKREPVKFHAILREHIRNKNTHDIVFIDRLPLSLLTYIVEQTNDPTLQIFSNFFSKLKTIAVQNSINSKVLQILETKLGYISLKTYIALQKTKETPLKALLFEIIESQVLDLEFIQILNIYTQEIQVPSNSFLISFVEEFLKDAKENTNISTAHSDEFNAYSQQLYTYYTKQKIVSFSQYQADLAIKNYNTNSYKFVIALLAVVAKNHNYSQKHLIDWITQRFIELQKKEVQIAAIFIEVIQILQSLTISNDIVKAIAFVRELLEKTTLEKKPSETNRNPQQIISDAALQQFLTTLKSLFFNRTQTSLVTDITTLLHTFSERHAVQPKAIIEYVQQTATHIQIPQFLIALLQQAASSETTIQTITEENDQYALDVVAYFFSKGNLPWWTIETTKVSLRKAMHIVLQQYPEQFIKWFKKSSFQKTAIDRMDNALYETFITQITTPLEKPVLAIKHLFEVFLTKDLASVLHIAPQQQKEFRYTLLQSLHKNNSFDSVVITQFLLNELSNSLKFNKAQLHAILLERIQANTNSVAHLKKVKQWLTDQVITPKFQFEETLQKIDTGGSWKSIVAIKNSEDILKQITSIYKNKPQEIRFYLKRISFRRNLLQQLNLRDQKALLQELISSEEQTQLQTIFDMFKKFRKRITAQTYEAIWLYFVDRFLVKIAINSTHSWSINEWSILILNSINTIQNTNTINSLIAEAILPNNTISKEISENVVQLIEEEKKQKEQDLAEEIPIVIEKETIEGTVFIENAGIVLLGPYIPMLFERMGLTENKIFKDDAAKQKALYVLQYAATGNTDPEEHVLLLNKIICDINIHEPLGPVVPLTSEEMSLIDSLLEAIINHWSALGNTSVEGLRVAFLTRPASIVEEEKKFVMVVEQKSYDMLLDQIPWSIGQLRLKWMEKSIEVLWRT
ncbi:contractile injection system tape measure protein [Tenacibaculum amylolyticum]|uniref:contractile injection system tape measure protein n=1 Tax=Tenacibaculum amylolyticum TaxID=104269 RepID=UPI0038952AC5